MINSHAVVDGCSAAHTYKIYYKEKKTKKHSLLNKENNLQNGELFIFLSAFQSNCNVNKIIFASTGFTMPQRFLNAV